MKDYAVLIAVFLLLFGSIQLEVNRITPPILGYVFGGVVIAAGFFAYRRHRSAYVRSMLGTVVGVQLLFQVVLPYWIFSQGTALNLTWPHYPDVLWATGYLALYYFVLSFVVVPLLVLLFDRRAWCSFACMLGALAETLGDRYRTRGTKARALPRGFVILKWVTLAGTAAVTVPALAGHIEEVGAFLWFYLIIFVFILRALLSLAVNIICMPHLGTRIWCRYFCPQGLVLGLLSRISRFALIRNDDLCKNCGVCNQHCSMALDISGGPAVNRSGDCVGGGVCVEVCPRNALSMTTDIATARKKAETLRV